jgi:hypothetical protein
MNARRILSTSAVATAAVLLSVGVQTLAYTAPTSAPTTIDADAPLNVGSSGQTKAGSLFVNSAGSPGSLGLRVGGDIRTLSGNLKVVDGSGLGYALIVPKICFGTSGVADITTSDDRCKSAWPAAADASSFLTTGTEVQTKTGVLKLGVAPGAAASDVSLVLDGKIRIEGGTPGTGKVLRSGAGGDASWMDPLTELNLQKAVNDSCYVGSSITAINATTGAVTCGLKFQAGSANVSQVSKSHTVSITSFGTTNYTVVIMANDARHTGCGLATVTQKNLSSFVFTTGDNCDSGFSNSYNWIAVAP